ncbi:MAG: hypothetical protein L0K86_04235 [Actinomycetia bacterium]|nr:hypothetical protein [Actinomycetes bacterium]
MSTEDRLRDALRETADARAVDADAMYTATRDQIDRPTEPRRRRTALYVAASAAAVVGIAVGGLWSADQLGGGQGTPQNGEQVWGTGPVVQTHRAKEGAVDDTFTCDHRIMLKDFLDVGEQLGGGPDMGAGHFGAKRYEFVPHGDTALMRVGKADGALTAKIHLVDRGDWVLDRIERCTGPEGSDADMLGRFQLGAHGRPIPNPPRPTKYDPETSSSVVPIDDRRYYNRIGVVDHRTIYAYESDGGVIVSTVETELDYREFGDSATFGPDQVVDGLNFVDEYGRLTSEGDFAFLMYYSTEPVELSVKLKDGRTVDAKEIRGDDWDGTLYALLAPREQVDRIVVKHGGETKTYEGLRDLHERH